MSLASDARTFYLVVRRAIGRRRERREWERGEADRGPLPEGHFTAAIYFADTTTNIYQIRQWYAPMVELSATQPVAVIARNVRAANLLRKECPLPVFYLPYIAHVEQWVDSQKLGAVFYVNHNRRNFSMIAFPKPAHVFLSHGESDKVYMASNQLKGYDFACVAGTAARERIAARLFDYDVDKRTIEIGRPQVDVVHEGPELPHDDREVVLYAPTCEGDRPSMRYTSVASHGEAIVSGLVATGRHRVIYRPHPRVGASDKSFGRAHQRIVAIIEEANRTDPSAKHMVDMQTPFGWHLQRADACVSDISAVAFDWLATGKPIVLTEPSSPDAIVDRTGIAGMLPTLDEASAGDIVAALEAASGADAEAAAAVTAVVQRYFGDVTPGASMARFIAAITGVIVKRRAAIERSSSVQTDETL